MKEMPFDEWDKGWYGAEDPTCYVNCPNCGRDVPNDGGLIDEHEITWCECGRGFKSKFDVIMYIKEDGD